MATLVTPSKLQKMEYNVTTAEGAGHVTIVSGVMQVFLEPVSLGAHASQQQSFKTLLDPTLTPGQFRKAVATASFGTMSFAGNPAPILSLWSIDDVQASFDDESGKVQLLVDISAAVQGASVRAQIGGILFQVTTLAMA